MIPQVSSKVAVVIVIAAVLVIGLFSWRYFSSSPSHGPDKPGPDLNSMRQMMFGSKTPAKAPAKK